MITKSHTQPLTVKANKEEFAAKLMSLEKYYHINHPMHEMMHAGKCTQEQLQGWVLNRFYYQVAIPRKDAFILAASHDKNFRRIWRQRIIDHDGDGVDGGGIEAWLALGEACGLKRQDVESCEHVLPGVRFAVDAYVNFVRHAPWQESVCSSLTELFAPKIHQQRLSNWPKNYPFVEEKGFAYFRKRLTEARRDVEHGLDIVLNEFDTLEKQNRALCILQFKLDVLWSMADAIYLAYIINEPPYHSVN